MNSGTVLPVGLIPGDLQHLARDQEEMVDMTLMDAITRDSVVQLTKKCGCG